jgi:Family of unknown function (DUF6477)
MAHTLSGLAATLAPQPFKVATYDRARDLPRLLPLWPEQIADKTLTGTAQIVSMLDRACNREAQRGRSNDWTYSPARHRQMMAALKHERSALAQRAAELLG